MSKNHASLDFLSRKDISCIRIFALSVAILRTGYFWTDNIFPFFQECKKLMKTLVSRNKFKKNFQIRKNV